MNWQEALSRVAQIYRLMIMERKRPDPATAQELDALLARISFSRLRTLELRADSHWQRNTEQATAWLQGHRAFGPSLLFLATMDRNGYFREAAVRLLTAPRVPGALPFLLLATADPVKNVREVAQRALERHWGNADSRELIQALQLALQFAGKQQQSRAAGSLFVREHVSALSDELLAEVVATGGAEEARFCLRRFAERRSPILAASIAIALASNEGLLALDGARALASVTPDERARLLAQALRIRARPCAARLCRAQPRTRCPPRNGSGC